VMMESVANWGYVLFLSLEVEENEGWFCYLKLFFVVGVFRGERERKRETMRTLLERERVWCGLEDDDERTEKWAFC
jgi:hypothetical protein